MATLSHSLAEDLEELRASLSPFDVPSLLAHPSARRLIDAGARSSQELMAFLRASPDPSLARVAMIVLSRLPTTSFYQDLLALIGRADQTTTEALDAGFWSMQIDPAALARDLTDLVTSTGNPHPLLLLQRPASKFVRAQLASFIEQRKTPLSLYALYAYMYALEPGDVPILLRISNFVEFPEIAALAGIALLRLKNRQAATGVRAGLTAADAAVRLRTLQELAQHIPADIFRRVRYDPNASPESQMAEVDKLLSAVDAAVLSDSSENG